AAAGRALKTVEGAAKLQFNNNKEITASDIRTLEFSAVQDAQEELASGNDIDSAVGYHFVGYSVMHNYLDGMEINQLAGQRGTEAQTEVVATFLPRVVVDSLLTVIRDSDLEVEHLTLEPIAASNLLIPQQMHDFNLALVDIGAGTSDIAVTKEGTIIGYAMAPVAGDEITDVICNDYMLDYHTAEEIKRNLTDEESFMIKDILDQEVEVPTEDILGKIEPKVEELAGLIGDKIIELNQTPPQAVICFGGGSLTPLLKEKLAQALELPVNRIGIKNQQDSNHLTGEIEQLSITQGITPLGIGVSTYLNSNQANFLDVTVNDDLIHLFTLEEPQVSDALLAAEIDFKELEPNLGLALTVEVEDEIKVIPGEPGTAGEVRLNGSQANLDTPLSNGDQLEVEFGQQGQEGSGVVADVVPDLVEKEIVVNGEEVTLKPQYYLDGQLVELDTPLYDRAKITYQEVDSVGDVIAQLWELDLSQLQEEIIEYTINGENRREVLSNYQLKLNDQRVDLESEISNGDELEFEWFGSTVEELTIGDVLDCTVEDSTLEIIINSRPLEISAAGSKLLKNGEEASLQDKVESGDQITYREEELSLKEILDYINYPLSNSDLEKVEIEKNGTPVGLETKVSNDDRIDIGLAN
ncbi:MAG: cell division FtsA domain-containing protein, partial [Bacillota bacterium]